MKKKHLSDLKSVAIDDRDSLLYEIAGPSSEFRYPDFSIAKIVLKPGAVEMNHYHNESEEIYLFTSGKGLMQVDRQGINVAEDDMIVIQSGEWHYLTVVGDEALEFFAIMKPAFSQDDYYTK
ncbi:MAG: cupin domain-containing protein [Anaerolineaceae bacterium]|nr:cupin domain-containing protein [Anaerolineaceae bacterium]